MAGQIGGVAAASAAGAPLESLKVPASIAPKIGIGLQSAVQSETKARDEGASAGNALKYGALNGLMNAATEGIAGGIPGLGEGSLDPYIAKLSQPEAARYAVLAGKLRAAVDAGGEANIVVIGGPVEARYSIDEKTIKQQIEEHQEELNEMSPVATIQSDGYEGLKNQSQRSEQAIEELRKFGFSIEREGFGTIVFGKKQINKSMDYLKSPAERAAIAAVPAVLKRGIVISEASEHKTRGFDTITFGAPVRLNGKVGNMGVVVKLLGKNLYKTHRILSPDGSFFVLPEKADAELGSDGRFFEKPEAQIQSTSSASIDNIAQSSENGKGENSGTKHALDEDYMNGLVEDAEKRDTPVQPWEETERQAGAAGYPVLDGKQVFPFKTWVQDRERGNYGLVVGKAYDRQDGQLLTVSFWNKDQGARAKVDIPVSELQAVSGKYQPADAELRSLFQTEPPDSLRGAVSKEDYEEYRSSYDEAHGIKPGTTVEYKFEDLPPKASSYATRAENRLVKSLAETLDVPYRDSRNELKPLARTITEEYLRTGTVSQKTVDALFGEAWDRGIKVDETFYNDNKYIKDELKDTAVSITKSDAADIPDFGD